MTFGTPGHGRQSVDAWLRAAGGGGIAGKGFTHQKAAMTSGEQAFVIAFEVTRPIALARGNAQLQRWRRGSTATPAMRCACPGLRTATLLDRVVDLSCRRRYGRQVRWPMGTAGSWWRMPQGDGSRPRPGPSVASCQRQNSRLGMVRRASLPTSPWGAGATKLTFDVVTPCAQAPWWQAAGQFCLKFVDRIFPFAHDRSSSPVLRAVAQFQRRLDRREHAFRQLTAKAALIVLGDHGPLDLVALVQEGDPEGDRGGRRRSRRSPPR